MLYKAEGEMSGVEMSYNALFPTNTLHPLEPYFVFICRIWHGIMNEVCSRKRNQEATITDANH